MNRATRNTIVLRYRRRFERVYESSGAFGFRVDHGIRVMRACELLLPRTRVRLGSWRRDALHIAALYADLGKLKAMNRSGELVYGSDGNLRHAEHGASMLPELLRGVRLDPRVVPLAQQCIREQAGRNQMLVEAKIVKDADRLDSYGVHQIWRQVSFAIHSRRRIDQLWEFWHDNGGRRTAKRYLHLFHFPYIRGIAARRFNLLDQALIAMHREHTGADLC